MWGDCEPYRELFEEYEWNVETALKICKAESGGNPKAENTEYHRDADCNGSWGLMQDACVHGVPKEELFKPEANIKLAYQLWLRSGWNPWGVCRDGKVDCGLAT